MMTRIPELLSQKREAHTVGAWPRTRQLLASVLVVLVLATSVFSRAQTINKTMALTFDDLPVSTIGPNPSPEIKARAANITQKALSAVAKHKALAIGFVNEIKLNVPGARDFYCGLLTDWLAQGHLLGNHGYSHLAFSQVPLQQYEDDFVRGDVITAALLEARGISVRYYRFPYNDTGDTAEKKQEFLKFLAAHGYRPAPVTFENDDWMYTDLYEVAFASNDVAEMAKLRSAYLQESEEQIVFLESLSEKSFHRQIALIADLHVNQLNADVLDDLLTLLERHGYRFIPIERALADPVYEREDESVGHADSFWSFHWQIAFGKAFPYDEEPHPPQWVQDEYQGLLDWKRAE